MVSQKTLEKWNKEFNSLSDAEKRVAIAKDVLAQIKKEVIIPQRSTYLKLNNWRNFEETEQVNKHINKVECTCCALGSMFLSHIKYNNHCTVEDLLGFDSDRIVEKGLEQYFDSGQLVLMETAFERWEQNYNEDYDEGILQIEDGIFHGWTLKSLGLTEDDLDKAGRLYDDIDDDTERLTLIMKNLIKNKGEFKLEL
jgi:hypothetical protein